MKITTKKLVLNALMIAVVFLITYLPFLHIPSPIALGYFNIGDAAIMITALLLGRKSGFLAGAIGSALADLVWGAFLFVPITFLVKGLEGYVVGILADKLKGDSNIASYRARVISLVSGAIVMVVGYFTLEVIFLRIIDKSLAFTAIISELPGNLIQGTVSAVIAYILIALIYKSNIIRSVDFKK